MDSASILVWTLYGFVTDPANKTVAIHYHVDILGDQQFHATEERVDINFLVLVNDGIAEIQAQSATKGIEPRTVESFTFISVLVTTESHIAADALAVFTQRQGALEPLRRIFLITVDNKFTANIEQEDRTQILNPGLLQIQMDDSPHVSQFQQGCHDKNDSDDCSSCHNFLFFVRLIRAAWFIFTTAKFPPNAHFHKFLGYSAGFCDEWRTIWDKLHKCDE